MFSCYLLIQQHSSGLSSPLQSYVTTLPCKTEQRNIMAENGIFFRWVAVFRLILFVAAPFTGDVISLPLSQI